MATDVTFDRDTILSMTQKMGIIQTLTRGVRISGLEPDSYDDNQDYWRLLYDALYDSLDSLGASPGALLVDERYKNADADLVLVSIDVAFIDKAVADLVLTYENIHNTDFQKLNDPVHGVLFYKTTHPQESVQTNLDQAAVPLSVKHTYKVGDDRRANGEITQGGMLTVTKPSMIKTLTGVMYNVKNPDKVTTGLHNKVNSATWEGLAVGTVQCTAADWHWMSSGSLGKSDEHNLILFNFEFTWREGGWDPTISFIDSRDGKPPDDLVVDEGYKTIPYYSTSAIDFNTYFKKTEVYMPDDGKF